MAPSSAAGNAVKVCTAAFFESGSVSSECFTLGLSKLLGTFVILGGVGFKVPQILKIAKNKSADGIALSQFLFELCISAITLSFNYHISAPFSTYGESFFILCQNIVIVFQVSFYKKVSPVAFLGGWAIYALILVFLFSDLGRDMKLDAPVCTFTGGVNCKISLVRLQDALQVVSTAFVIISRVPQILTNFRTRNVENLSVITWGLNLVGASIRVFTTIREIPDQTVLIFAYVITAALSGTVVLQILAFGGKKPAAGSQKVKPH